jgi:hypothetical protein
MVAAHRLNRHTVHEVDISRLLVPYHLAFIFGLPVDFCYHFTLEFTRQAKLCGLNRALFTLNLDSNRLHPMHRFASGAGNLRKITKMAGTHKDVLRVLLFFT